MDFYEALDWIKCSNFRPKPEKYCFKVENAKDIMQKALNFFCDDKAKWGKGYDEIADWLSDSKEKGLLLIGDCGVGKTLICTSVIPMIMARLYDKRPARYSAYNLNRKSEEIITERSDVLIIDDIGVEDIQVNYGERSIVFNEVVDQAERLGQILILTTNLSKEQLTAKYGARTIDRLMAITRMIVLKGKSLRNK